jgi:endonuclease/exonuclease/phosphatase family metal-dependent hydrolase
MVRLASADAPDVLCLQELPAWAQGELAGWSAMQTYGDIAQPPRLGPLPIPAGLGREITSLNHGLLRSAVSGQANAILVSDEAKVLGHERLVLNSRDFREAQSRWLSLPLVPRLAWAKERRIVQAIRFRLADGRTFVVGNLHATAYEPDQRLADAELLRAAVFVDGIAQPDDVVVLAGDFNVPAARSATQPALAGAEWGFSEPLSEGIDQVLVRGAAVESLTRWPESRRRLNGKVLSDHAPVEAVAA